MRISVSVKVARDLHPNVPDYRGEDDVEWAQEKENGHNVVVVVERHKIRRVLSRTKDYWEKLQDHFVLAAQIRKLPAKTILFGELHLPQGRATDVPRAMKNKDPKLTLTPYAVPVLKGEDLRGLDFEKAMELICDLGFKPPDTHEISLYEDDLEQFYLECAEELGIEGFVLKSGHCKGWYRIKPVKTVDLIVTGFKWGNGNFAGLVGALKCSGYNEDGKLEEVASISGMKMDEREGITDLADKDNLEGRIVEVKYGEVGSQGRLFHPRFVRFRDDKPERECVLEQLWA